VYSADADGGRGLCVFGGLCVDMWRLVHQWSFFCCLTVFDYWCTVGTLWLQSKNCPKQSKDNQNSKHDHYCTNHHMSTKTVPTVYQSSKAVKNSQTAKMTIGVPIVTCLHRVCRIHKVRVRRLHPPNTQSHYFVMTVNGFWGVVFVYVTARLCIEMSLNIQRGVNREWLSW